MFPRLRIHSTSGITKSIREVSFGGIFVQRKEPEEGTQILFWSSRWLFSLSPLAQFSSTDIINTNRNRIVKPSSSARLSRTSAALQEHAQCLLSLDQSSVS
jgi:hypothetical protein